MDWIERILHISPDGGTGATETLIALLFLLVIVAASLLKNLKRAGKHTDLQISKQ